MNRTLIITDLTRFSTGNPKVCIAGLDQKTGECIRPMPYLAFTECSKLGILPGGILTGEFTPIPTRTPPHLEDYFIDFYQRDYKWTEEPVTTRSALSRNAIDSEPPFSVTSSGPIQLIL